MTKVKKASFSKQGLAIIEGVGKRVKKLSREKIREVMKLRGSAPSS